MLRFTNWMGESIDTLQNHPDAAPTDKRLIAWVMLQRIMEASSSSLALDDTSADVNLADPRTQLTLKAFERQLEEWKRSIPPGVMSRKPLHPNTLSLVNCCQPARTLEARVRCGCPPPRLTFTEFGRS